MKHAAAALTLAWIAVFPGFLDAAEFFSDDFEAYLDDTDLVNSGSWQPMNVNTPVENATWTITNPGGRANPPGADGAPSVGIFLISDSDKADGDNPTGSGMSHDIWSPSFDCEDAERVWLHLDCSAQLNNNGRAVFDVDVSTDGGATWVNVFRRVAPGRATPPAATLENADGFFGRLDVDLSEQAAGESEVMFRLRHFEPNDDWWIAVDNVLVDDQPPPRGEVVVLPRQGFSQGIPDGWKIDSLVGATKTWSTEDVCARSLLNASNGVFPDAFDGRGLHHFDETFAIIDNNCAATVQDEYLITPPIDCTKCDEVFLHFKSATVPAATLQEVLVSTDGGLTFKPTALFSWFLGGLMVTGEEPFYGEYTFPAVEAAGVADLAFAFHYQGSGGGGWWAIDDVEISARGDLDPRGCENRGFEAAFNAANGTVTANWKSIPGDQGFRLFRDAVQLGGDLPATATSFTDTAPPPGGTAVAYQLRVLAGGAVEKECLSSPVRTFACPESLSCTVDQETGRVTLNWKKGTNLNSTGVEISRNGEPVSALGPGEESFSEATEPGVFDYQLKVIPGAGADPSQCAAPLSCRAVVVDDHCFFEDFERFADDAALEAAGWRRVDENTPVENATWTIRNPAGRANPPIFDGRPSTGKFVISDSDDAAGANPTGSGMSHDLWSPSISTCAGQAAVWLHLDISAQLNNNGVCVFDLDVSTDDGAIWKNVLRRVAPARTVEPAVTTDNADGLFGRLDLDLTEHVAGKPSFRFRLRHFEPNDDWWIAVDDVLVDDVPAKGGKKVVLPLQEFDDGIPGDWVVESRVGSVANWTGDDLCFRSTVKNGLTLPDTFDGRGLHRLDEYFAIVDSPCSAEDQDEILSTPVLDCSALRQVYLHFQSDLVVSASAVQEVLVSLDGGETHYPVPVFSYNGGGLVDEEEDPFYNEYVLPVPQAAGKSEVVFSFHFAAPAGQALFWAIDEVLVTGDEATSAPVFHRGDADGNGALDLTDPIFILNYLFLGGPASGCTESTDINEDGQPDISDAVGLLNYQFLGGPPPAAPGPPGNPCGPDPAGSPSNLGCLSYQC